MPVRRDDEDPRDPAPVDPAPGTWFGHRARELGALAVIGIGLFAMLALATLDARSLDHGAIARGGLRNLGGTVGYYIADASTFLFGIAAWALFAFVVAYGVLRFLARPVERLTIKLTGVVVFTAMLALLLAGSDGGASEAARLWPYGPGGRFGGNLSPRLNAAFGGSGRILVVAFGSLVALMLATDCLLSTLILRSVAGLERGVGRLRERLRGPRAAVAGALAGGAASVDDAGEVAGGEPAGRRSWLPWRRSPVSAAEVRALDREEDDGEAFGEDAAEDEIARIAEEGEADADAKDVACANAGKKRKKRRRKAVQTPKGRGSTSPTRGRRRPRQPELPFAEPYSYPPLDLFQAPESSQEAMAQSVLDANKAAIEQRLASFGLTTEVVAASVGPAVTQYELNLGEGIKMSRITAYESDLAAALRAVAVRVVAPIPGKHTVGVEVPNKRRQTVYLRELLEEFGTADDRAIPLFLGRDVAGEPIVEDLAAMPHLLIAGTTGSGKSVCINSILLSILMTRSPEQVRLILIDPKMVELQGYSNVPHLSCDVVSNMKRAPAVLEWAVEEMERRYALLSTVRVNHIRAYNRLGKDEIEQRRGRPIDPGDAYLPYQVLVIDELADLMSIAQKDVEESIQRLAQKSRSVGLHVILATQRPSADVITGIIKANLPSQIAFKVSRKLDSRVILDHNGAEKLLGFGDMLFVSPASGQLVRAQGTFVADEEIAAVVEYIETHGPRPEFISELVQTETRARRKPDQRDDLYEQAVEVILGQQRGSATLIQRALSVGYTRATRLLELMAEDGIVGPFVGSRSREVLMTIDEWKAREEAIDDELEREDPDDESDPLAAEE